MKRTISPYENVLMQAQNLDLAEQLRLLETLAREMRYKNKVKSTVSILELEGLGKAIWQDIDAQEYVKSERNSWGG